MTDLALNLSAQRFRGWQKIEIVFDLEAPAGAFNLSVTERFDEQPARRPIRPDEACSVQMDGQTVITGSVDVVSPSYDASAHTLTVQGRDATGDLVDCAVLPSGRRWQERTLAQVAKDICAPFGIQVIVDADVGTPIRELSAEPGETGYAVIERAARYRGLLTHPDGLGNLVITTPGKRRAPQSLVLGENILAATGQASYLQRFKEYIVQAQLAQLDGMSAADAVGPEGRAVDPVITRYRPTILLAEDQADAAQCQRRADYQLAVAAARANAITYTVNGWFAAKDTLWRINERVPVRDRYMGIDAEWLITRVAFVLDERGERTDLTVMPPKAFDALAVPEPEPGALWQ